MGGGGYGSVNSTKSDSNFGINSLHEYAECAKGTKMGKNYHAEIFLIPRPVSGYEEVEWLGDFKHSVMNYRDTYKISFFAIFYIYV